MSGENIFECALITGIAGSGGSYLAEFLVSNVPQLDVHGISRWHSTASLANLNRISDRVSVHEADLTDFGSTLRVLQEVKPDVIFHLASHANVRTSFVTPNAVLRNNILGTSNLFEAIRLTNADTVVQLCSTSEVYGKVDPENIPITEEAPFRPASPYGVSKVTQDLLGWTYFVSYNLKIIRTRMFTYLNPRRTDLFATSFAKQIAWIERGLKSELTHGNLDSIRTIIDVRDAMEAYWIAIQHCKPGEAYNIGGQASFKVGEILDMLISMSDTSISTRLDQNLLRPADVTLQIPCTEKFTATTGWRPAIDIEQSLADLLDYWRSEAAQISI